MTTTTTPNRHRWTAEELKALDVAIKEKDSKKEAFLFIADQMGLPVTAVSGTYYNHQRKDRNPSKAVKRGPGRPRKAAQAKTPVMSSGKNKAINSAVNVNPIAQGRPFDFSQSSESELIELTHALRLEIARRQEALSEAWAMFETH